MSITIRINVVNLGLSTLVVLLALGVAGCMPEHSVVGRWSSSFRDVKVTLDLKPDGTLTGTGGFEGMNATVKGHYKMQDQDVSIVVDQADFESPDPNPMLLIVGAKLKGQKETGRIEWKNDNEFVLTNSKGIPIVFDRVRE